MFQGFPETLNQTDTGLRGQDFYLNGYDRLLVQILELGVFVFRQSPIPEMSQPQSTYLWLARNEGMDP